MTATVDPGAKQTVRFVVLYDTPSDVDSFERHYEDVHISLAKQYPGCVVTRAAMNRRS